MAKRLSDKILGKCIRSGCMTVRQATAFSAGVHIVAYGMTESQLKDYGTGTQAIGRRLVANAKIPAEES